MFVGSASTSSALCPFVELNGLSALYEVEPHYFDCGHCKFDGILF